MKPKTTAQGDNPQGSTPDQALILAQAIARLERFLDDAETEDAKHPHVMFDGARFPTIVSTADVRAALLGTRPSGHI